MGKMIIHFLQIFPFFFIVEVKNDPFILFFVVTQILKRILKPSNLIPLVKKNDFNFSKVS